MVTDVTMRRYTFGAEEGNSLRQPVSFEPSLVSVRGRVMNKLENEQAVEVLPLVGIIALTTLPVNSPTKSVVHIFVSIG